MSAAGRVTEFLRQWALMRDKTNVIYGVHADLDAEMADLCVSDLRELLNASHALRARAEIAEQAANACVDARWFTGSQQDADDALRAYRISRGEMPEEIELERDR